MINPSSTYNILLLILTLISLSSTKAQKGKSSHDLDFFNEKDFKKELTNQFLIEWEKLLGHPLNRHNALDAAAKDQVEYIKATGRIGNIQNKPGKRTVIERVKHYNGYFSFAEEMEIGVPLNKKTKLPGLNETKLYTGIKELVKDIVESWKSDKNFQSVRNFPYFFNFGLEVSYDQKRKMIYACVVLANKEYDFFDIPTIQKNLKKLKPFDKKECSLLEKDYSYLPALLSENIIISNDSIYFYFHDIHLLKKIFDHRKDGIAAELVLRDQYDCTYGITLYPGDLIDGYLLKPIFKKKLFSKNLSDNDQEIKVFIGKTPENFRPKIDEVNLFILKNACICQTVIYNNLGGRNLRLMDLELALDTFSFSSTADTTIKQLSFTIPFTKGKYEYTSEDIKPFLDSLQINSYYIKEVDITAYSSIEGDTLINEKLQKKRAESILQVMKDLNLDNVKYNVYTKENWDGFFQSLEGSPYESFFKKLSRQSIRDIVNSDTLKFNLEPYLADQRKADIILKIEKIKWDSAVLNNILPTYIQAIKKQDAFYAKALQSLVYREIVLGKISYDSLAKIIVPHTPDMAGVACNHYTLMYIAAKLQGKNVKDQLFKLFLALKLTNPTHPYVLHNYYLLQLEDWSKNYESLSDPESLLKDIKKLYNTRIENWRVNRLVMNFSIIAADYYYEKNDFDKREKYLKEAKKYLLQSQLDREQTIIIADYFIFQMRTDWVLEILKPWIDNNQYDQQILFRYLKMAIYHPEKISISQISDLLEKAKQLNLQEYCHLFGYPQMSFQLLENLSILKHYCESCKP